MYCYYPEEFTVLIGLEDQVHSIVNADVNIDNLRKNNNFIVHEQDTIFFFETC